MIIQRFEKLVNPQMTLLGILVGVSLLTGCASGVHGRRIEEEAGVVMDTIAQPHETAGPEIESSAIAGSKTGDHESGDRKTQKSETVNSKTPEAKTENRYIQSIRTGSDKTENSNTEKAIPETGKTENSNTENVKTKIDITGNDRTETGKAENSKVQNPDTEITNSHATEESPIKDDSNALSCKHVYMKMYWPNAPTCTMGGAYTNVCSLCGAEDGTGTHMEPALDHDFRAVELQHGNCVDCTRVEYTCNSCGYSYIEAYLEAEDHDWTEGVTEIWNEEEHGIEQVTYEYCTRCHAQR